MSSVDADTCNRLPHTSAEIFHMATCSNHYYPTQIHRLLYMDTGIGTSGQAEQAHTCTYTNMKSDIFSNSRCVEKYTIHAHECIYSLDLHVQFNGGVLTTKNRPAVVSPKLAADDIE